MKTNKDQNGPLNHNDIKKDTSKFKNPNFIISFGYAMDGIIHAFKNEKNFRKHIFTAIIVAVVSLLFDLSRVEMAMLCLTISMVMISELINTSIENIVDLIYNRVDKNAKIAKDIGAGAVLIAAINSVFVGYFIFYDRIVPLSHAAVFKIQKSPTHLAFIALVLVILFTIILKSIFYKGHGTYLQGGTVSGHSSIAFCAATMIAYLANNTLVTILSLLLAFLVAESRVEGKIHSLSEVIFGGILGVLIATLIFKLMV